jgi:hypothetical protein
MATSIQLTPGTPLPSQSSAAALVSGDLSAAPMVAMHLLGRAALIAAGLAIIPAARKPEILVGGSLLGSGVIELFVLLHELTNQASRT